MNIPKEYTECFETIAAGKSIELQDDKTKIIVRCHDESYKIKVDGGIISDESHGIRKSDYAIIEEADGYVFIMELKGAVIDEALKQLYATVQNFEQSSEWKKILERKNKIISCVISPNRQQLPRGGSSRERELAKKLYRKCMKKPKDMYQLIYYIRVVPKQGNPTINRITRQVICSNRNPLVMDDLDTK